MRAFVRTNKRIFVSPLRATLAIGLVLAGGWALFRGIPASVGQDPPLPQAAVSDGQSDVRVALEGTVMPAAAPLPVVSESSAQELSAEARLSVVSEVVAGLFSGGPTLDLEQLNAMIDRARDPDEALADRMGAIRWLARYGDDEALDVLEGLLTPDTPSEIRVAVAIALAECSNPAAARILTSCLDDGDPHVVAAAIRSLADHRDPETTQTLKALVADASLDPELRSEAAAALGRHEGAGQALRDAYAQSEGDLSSGALEGLARQPFGENEPIFRKLMEDPNASIDLKVEGIEALGDGAPGAAEFLLEIARSAQDPELRSAAIDALALSDEPGDTLGELAALVRSELSADVRADLYNTLAFHPDQVNPGADTFELVRIALGETGSRPQLEGYRMVASILRARYEPQLADTFDQGMVDWLQDSAQYGGDNYTRHLSMNALSMAGTPGAQEALLDLARSSDLKVSQSAEKALRVAGNAGGL